MVSHLTHLCGISLILTYCRAYIVDLDEERLKIFGGRDITDENHPFNEQFNTLGDWLDVPKLLLTYTFAELRGWDEEEYRRCMRGYH